jgi:acyl carrier protein
MAKLDQLVSDLFDDDDAVADDTLFADLAGWDSLKHVELIVGLEAKFGIELTAAEIERLTSKRAAREILAERHVAD